MAAYKITATDDCEMTFVLNGAGGGDGGSDSRAGAIGSPGDKMTVLINAQKDEEFYVVTGTAGANGVSGSNANGGAAGYSLDGFSGGKGGKSGPSGWSGSGGGGGGATVLYKIVNGVKKYLAVAAGGAGGGGGGNHSVGKAYDAIKRVTSQYAKYYTTTDDYRWSKTLRSYAVRNGSGWYDLEYTLWIETAGQYKLYSSADDVATIYVNGTNIGNSASWGSTSSHTITLNYGFNTLKFHVGNTGGGPTGYGAYITNSSNSIIWTTRYSYNEQEILWMGRGGEGQSHSGSYGEGSDGGGAGGGGGGFMGGAGGKITQGDHGGYSGYPGISIAMPFDAANFVTSQWLPVASSSINILGGSARKTDGSFQVSARSSNIKIKYERVLDFILYKKTIEGFNTSYDVYYKQNGAWTPIKEVYVKNNGEWIPLMKKDSLSSVSYSESAYNNISGYPQVYTDYNVYEIYYSSGGGYDSGTSSFGGTVSDGYGGTVSDGSGNAVGW